MISYGQNLNMNPQQKQLPQVDTITADNYELAKTFIDSCTEHYVNHTYKFSSPPEAYDSSSFFNWAQTDTVFIISKDNRRLGYVLLHTNDTLENSLTSFTYFVHPSVCKLNTVNLIIAGFVLAVYRSSLVRSRTVVAYANHSLLVNSINNLFPNTKTYTIQQNLYYIVISFTGLSSQQMKDNLTQYYTKDSLAVYEVAY